MKPRLKAILIAGLITAMGPFLAQADQRTLFGFDEPDAAKRWQTVNDGVMGGRSAGLYTINGDKNLEFYGTLSLANNGGFASVRIRGVDLALAKDDVIVARVKGDGREYKFNIYDRRGMTAFSYRQSFKTKEGEWIEVELPLQDFVASWFGRELRNRKLNPADANGVGFLLADKKPGPFKLEVDWIKIRSAAGAEGTRGGTGDGGAGDIVDIASNAGTFKTLIAAAKAAGLVETLKSNGPLTVFAPTDAAFAKLPKGTVAALLKPENKDKLAAILKYHVVPGRVPAAKASKLDSARTALGQSLDITYLASSNPRRVPSKLLVNSATVIRADIQASNGVVHVIDSVLMPKATTPDQVMAILSDAIAKGVPMYNSGNRRGCADLYEKACRQVLSSTANPSDHAMRMLRMVVEHAASIDDATHKAWALRHGMDYAYRMLQHDSDRTRSARAAY